MEGVELAILEHFRITLPEGSTRATIELSNLDQFVTAQLPVSGHATPGAFTVPTVDFLKIARTADKGTSLRITVERQDATIHYTAKGLPLRNVLSGLDPDDFATAPDLPDEAHRSMALTEFFEAIHAVKPASSGDETRHLLQGVYVAPQNGGSVVATDGRRLAYVPTSVPCPASNLPITFVDLLAYPPTKSAARCAVSDEYAKFEFKDVTIQTKLIEGNYPNYLQVIPAGRNGSVTFRPNVVDALIAWLRKQKETVRIKLEGSKAELSVYDKATLVAATTIQAYITGEVPEKIAFHSAFLADGLAMGLTTLDIIDEISPAVLTNGNVRYVIMPMRTIETTEPPVDTEKEKEEEPPKKPTTKP